MPGLNRRAGRQGISFGNTAALALLVALLTASISWWQEFHHSRSEIDNDLLRIVKSARDSVEASRKAAGELPMVLPNPALGSVVQYEYDADHYQLTAVLGRSRVSINDKGEVKIEESFQE